jgi:ABC-2 type transport system ATP-binding protein
MPAISAQGLSKHYGNVRALDNLTLEVPENVVFGFLGPNGAGKTTTVKLLTGFSRPTSGQAWVAGEKVGDGNLALQARIGLLPDVPAFYDWMSGREFLRFAGELHHLHRTEINKRADELLELVELSKSGKRRIGGYSRGMKQRLGIAQSIINHPKVLFMDEPTSALDPIGRRDILELITRLKENTTIFMSTHILSDAERVCDIIGIVDNGRLITVSPVDALRKKYAPSVFEMEFMEDAQPFVETLKGIPWLAEPVVVVENGRQLLRVRAVEMERARKELPSLIGQSGLTLTRYELGMPTIEDIFVKILSGEDKNDRPAPSS